jgi:hypothetical protein
MLRAVASGETDPGTVAALGSPRLRATPDQFRDVLEACTDLDPVYRRLLAMTLDESHGNRGHIRQLDEELARLLRADPVLWRRGPDSCVTLRTSSRRTLFNERSLWFVEDRGSLHSRALRGPPVVFTHDFIQAKK